MPCFQRSNKVTGHKLIGLIDSGETNNYISANNISNVKLISLSKPKFVKTIHGQSKISFYVKINVFKHDLRFFVLDEIGNFDLILGMDGLRRINAIIDLTSFKMTYSITPQLQTINYIIDDEANEQTKSTIAEFIRENNQTTLLPFNTNVIAEIRTNTNQLIWSKQFPYPMSSIDFVHREIEKLLANGIIRPSHSPYNSPKDGFNEDGTPKTRLVID